MAGSGHSDRGESRGGKGNGATAIVVERITHEAIPDVCTLYKRVWDRFPDLPNELAKLWTPTPLEFSSWMEGVVYFAARIDGRTVGIIGLEIRDGSCRLLRLAVDPDARRKGVATALVHQALEWSRHAKCGSVWADALARFSGAASLLKRLGFDEAGVLHRHYLAEDVRLFEKLL